ncbi:MAG: M1 family metallopeptidase [Clostridia bacterium]
MKSVSQQSIIRLVISICLVVLLLPDLLSPQNGFAAARKKDTRVFNQQTVESASEGVYDLAFSMSKQGVFTVKASVAVTNHSKDDWSDLVFYFIPNMFTKETNKKLIAEGKYPYASNKPGTFRIQKVSIDGKKAKYSLDHDTFTVWPEKKLSPEERVKVDISYQFTLPEETFRFVKMKDHYYLAQWYPMLATYTDGWNKYEYTPYAETYHTAHSNFTVKYRIPKGYSLFSSADDDAALNSTSGTLRMKNVKEFFITIGPDIKTTTAKIDDVEIRVIAPKEYAKQAASVLEAATRSFDYFQQKIGTYPYKQLDVVMLKLGSMINMEYPGIVTVSPYSASPIIAHEVAHQWFYATVSNDPYKEAWLDEGLTTFAETLYLYDEEKLPESHTFGGLRWEVDWLRKEGKLQPANLPFPEYNGIGMTGSTYKQPALQLWEWFSEHGGVEGANRFLKTYYEQYAFKQVDTHEFVRFAKKNFKMSHKFFEEWLRL